MLCLTRKLISLNFMHLAACKQNTGTCHQTAQHYTTYSTACFRDDSVIISLLTFSGIQRYFIIWSARPYVSNAFVSYPNDNSIIFCYIIMYWLIYLLFFYESHLHSEIHIKDKTSFESSQFAFYLRLSFQLNELTCRMWSALHHPSQCPLKWI